MPLSKDNDKPELGGQSRRPRLRRERSEDVAQERHRSNSPSFFFKSSSSSNLLRFRQSRPPVHSSLSSRPPVRGSSDTEVSSMAQEEGNNMMIDVLPSFQLYNTLHRHIPRGNVNADLHDYPPSYQAVQQQAPVLQNGSNNSSTIEQIPQPSVPATPNLLSPSVTPSGSLANLQTFSASQVNIQALNTQQEPIEDDLSDNDNIFVDKLYSLPKLTTPIDIDIRITKNAVKPHIKPEEESILKEYTSGDIIHGYAVISNKSSQPLKFEMFYVTLEGYAAIVDKQHGKRTVKRFLRMVDLSASWSYANIDLSSGINYVPGELDYDNCILGLNNNRILEPGAKYKKFFMFKLPNQLLDISCKHEQFSHCLMPPSFGIDKFKSGGKYSSIKINPMLGYGHLGTKGSPILTNDLVNDNVSINYAVDAKVVGKDHKTQKLNIMREKEYNLRFIPFGFCQPLLGERSPLSQLKDLTKLVQERLGALDRVFQRMEKNEKITGSDVHSTDISGTIDDDSEIDSEEILRRKLQQLHVNNRIDPACSSFPVRNIKNLKREENMVESEFRYTIKSKTKSSKKLKKGFFTGFGANHPNNEVASTPSTSKEAVKSGIIVLTTKVPKDGLPYLQPSLLKKTNKLENKNRHDQESWESLTNSLSEEENKILSKLNIHLRCIQSNNSEAHEPPEIQSILTELVCITANSINCIPIKLSTEFLMNQDKVDSVRNTYKDMHKKIKDSEEKFAQNLEKLNELYNLSRRSTAQQELRFTDFISNQLNNDVESLANLKVDVRNLPHVFKKQVQTLENKEDGSPLTSSKSNSASNLLASTFSGPSNHHNHTSMAAMFKNQLAHEWIKSDEAEYDREITVNLQLNNDIKETIVPTFESCLCCRMYYVKVDIKFENHIGTVTAHVPIRIRKLEP